MKVFTLILIYILFLFFSTGKDESFQQKDVVERICIDATKAQDVQNVNSKSLSSQNEIEFWDERNYIEISVYH